MTLADVKAFKVAATHFMQVVETHPIVTRLMLSELANRVQVGYNLSILSAVSISIYGNYPTSLSEEEYFALTLMVPPQMVQQVQIRQNNVIQDAIELLSK